MIRDLDRLTARTFDMLVVGGGISGLALAYDAAQRGLAVALIERDDFGSGSSFNHLRTIHGGLRYLQALDIRRARESARERATLARIAPFALRPLPFVLPLYRAVLRGKTALRAGFMLDRIVTFDRNGGISSPLRLPAGRVISRADAVHRFPGLRRQGLTGAAIWYDYVTPESDRLTFAFAAAADEHGAVLANHCEALSLLVDGRRVTGARVRDCETNRELDVMAALTVNATGAWVQRLLTPLGLSMPVALMSAMNLVTSREAGDEALGGRSASGRHLFLVPWRGRALLGTWESGHATDGGGTGITRADVESFIRELNRTFPALDLTLGDVTLVHRGEVPAARAAHGRATLEGRECIRDHTADGVSGLIGVVGAKYTTARAVAERVLDRALARLHRPHTPCRTQATTLPGGSARDVVLAVADARRSFDQDVPSDTLPHLVAAYGSRYRDVLAIARDRPEWRVRVTDHAPVIGAELVWAVRKEMAITLADAVIRRTPLGALGYPGDEVVERAAALVGGELHWSQERREREIADVRKFYVIP